MGRPEVVIVGTGAISAVGLSTAEAAAAVRTGLMRFSEISFLDRARRPFVVAEVPDQGLAPLAAELEGEGLTAREARMLRLAAGPLREALDVLEGASARPPLLLALPEPGPGRALDGAVFLERLALQAAGGFDLGKSHATYRGRCGGLIAVGAAAEWIRSGRVNLVVAGGVDSYRDLFALGMLDKHERTKSEANLDGFVPGEGAAFVLLASQAAAEAAGLSPLVTVAGAAQGEEPGHLFSEEPYRGEGLATTLRTALATAGPVPPVQEVYSSMNGESYWAKEWGVATLRNRSALADDHRIHHPADCYGETGAAAGPLLAVLAARGIADGYRAAPAAVYASSDGPGRAALILTRTQQAA